MPHRLSRFVLAVLVGFGAPAASVQAEDASPWKFDLRYRYEHVDDAAFGRDAEAHTLRLRVGYLFAPAFAPGWSAFLEGERVENLNSRFNSTANGKLGFPTVADPESTELNQGWLGYRREGFEGRFGRQRILIDNHRFVGNVGWRQNEQTYDALWLAVTPSAGLRVQYGYLAGVQRVFGDKALAPLLRERDHDSHVLDIEYVLRPDWKLGTYALLLKDEDLAADSSATWGARFVGKQPLAEAAVLGWRLEYARQRDYRNQPLSFGLNYWRIEPTLSFGSLSLSGGWERLQGDGDKGFATPLATLHAFNGWADRFLSTPANGLDDRFLGLSGALGKARWAVIGHDYRATRGGADHGREWNASLAYPLPFGLSAMVKYADYRSDGFGTDVRKLWLQLEWKR